MKARCRHPRHPRPRAPPSVLVMFWGRCTVVCYLPSLVSSRVHLPTLFSSRMRSPLSLLFSRNSMTTLLSCSAVRMNSPVVSTMAVSAPATRAVLFSNVDCDPPPAPRGTSICGPHTSPTGAQTRARHAKRRPTQHARRLVWIREMMHRQARDLCHRQAPDTGTHSPARDTGTGRQRTDLRLRAQQGGPPSAPCSIAPQLEGAVFAPRSDARAIGTPVDSENLIGVARQILHQLAKSLAALIHVEELDGRIFRGAYEQPRIRRPGYLARQNKIRV